MALRLGVGGMRALDEAGDAVVRVYREAQWHQRDQHAGHPRHAGAFPRVDRRRDYQIPGPGVAGH